MLGVKMEEVSKKKAPTTDTTISFAENMPELEKALTRPPNPPVILPSKKFQAPKRPIPRKKSLSMKRPKKSVIIGSLNEGTNLSPIYLQSSRNESILSPQTYPEDKPTPVGSNKPTNVNIASRTVPTAKKTPTLTRKIQPPKLSHASRLLHLANVSPVTSHRTTSSYNSPATEGMIADTFVLSDYICKKSGLSKPVKQGVLTEHTYSKPHNWLPEHTLMRPVRYLFTEKPSDIKKQMLIDATTSGDEVVDIELVDGEISMPASDSWRSGASWRGDEPTQAKPKTDVKGEDDEEEVAWDETFSKEGWSSAQARLFTNVSGTLDALELRALVCAGTPSEGTTMRTAYDMHANDLRYHLINCNHDLRIPIWLHSLLVEKLPPHLKHHYRQLLARVRKAIPGIVEAMLKTSAPFTLTGRTVSVASVNANIELPTLQSDPVAEQLVREKFKRLPHSPVFLVVPDDHRMHRQPRFNLFTTMLHQMGATFTVPLTQVPDGTSVATGLERKMCETRARLTELRAAAGASRDLVLIGFETGAAVAALLALTEPTCALVCLGFPAVTLGGARGQPDDVMLDMRAPTLFVSGEHDITSSVPVLESMRSRMNIYTQLVVIGSADDRLVVPRHKLIDLGLTQAMVDKAILVEIHNFLGGLLTNPGSATAAPKLQAVKRALVEDKPTTRRYIKKQNKNYPGAVIKVIARDVAPVSLELMEKSTDITTESPTKRKARLLAAQQLMASGQSDSLTVVPGLWQGKGKGAMLSPDKNRRIASAPPSPGAPATPPSPSAAANLSALFATPSVPRAPTPQATATTPSSPVPGPAPMTACALPPGCYPIDPTSKLLKVLTSRPPASKVVLLGDNSLDVTSKVVKINRKFSPLTADNILNLPIIFAKDDDNIFQLGKSKMDAATPSTSEPQEIIPIDSEEEPVDYDVAIPPKVVNKFEFSKPQPGVKYRKIILTRMNQQSSGATSEAGPSNPKLLGAVKHTGQGRTGPGRPPGSTRRKNIIVGHQEHDYE